MFTVPNDFDLPPYSIPNKEKVINTLQVYIDREEELVLKKLLGTELYKSFINGLNDNPILDKWTKLRNGTTYVIGSNSYEWLGLKDLLIPYIYFKWLSDTFDRHSGIGVVQGNAENSAVIDPSYRMSRAYNVFARKCGVYVPRGVKSDDYYYSYDYRYREVYEVYNEEDTLYGFINANLSDYPNWRFIDPGLMNILNI